MKSAAGILIAIIMMLSPLQSGAWGKEGHGIVADIAMHYLSATARKNVYKILRKMSPADAGNWMDDMRSNAYYGYMQHWHYVDMPKDSPYVRGQGDNLIAAMNTAFNDLRTGTPNKEKKQEDMLIIFHLVGDMHQPLHNGYPEDKGGNSIQVNAGGSGTNLHHVWDSDIIEDQNITLDTCLAYGSRLTADEVKAIRGGSFLSWMYDSRALLPQVYDFQGHKLDSDYMQKNKAVVVRQLVKGGIRLARVLETLFGNNAQAPATQLAGIDEDDQPGTH